MAEILKAVPANNATGGGQKSIGANNTTLSWAHTCAAGSILFVNVEINGTHTVSAMAHGGVSLTLLTSNVSTNSKEYVYYTLTPFTGSAKNVTVTCSARGDTSGRSTSYTAVIGINSGSPWVFNNASAKSCTTTGTVGFPNSWIAGFGGVNARATYTIPSGGGTHRGNSGAAGITCSAMAADKIATPGAFSWIYHQGTTARIVQGVAVEMYGGTNTPTYTRTPTGTFTYTRTPTYTRTYTRTVTKTATETATPTEASLSTNTITPTITQTVTPTFTVTQTVTPTYTTTKTVTPTATETVTPTYTVTKTVTPTVTPTYTITQTITPTYTVTPTVTPTHTATKTITKTATETITPTITETITPTVTGTVNP